MPLVRVSTSLAWQSDTFAYAESYDGSAKRYVGLHAAASGLNIPSSGPGVLVKPDIALNQLTAESSEEKEEGDSKTSEGSKTYEGEETPTPSVVEGKPAAKFTRYHGSVKLKPTGAALEFSTIAEEVIQHFTSKLGTDVRITVEIEAESKDGFDDSFIRTVAENSNTLGFDHGEFEQE